MLQHVFGAFQEMPWFSFANVYFLIVRMRENSNAYPCVGDRENKPCDAREVSKREKTQMHGNL